MKLQTKNWNDLSKFEDVHKITTTDDLCLKEIQQVVEKYGLSSKFGVALLHKHFDIGEDEILLEKNDPITRSLITQPVKASEAQNESFATTIWRFDGGNRYGCSFCKKDHH